MTKYVRWELGSYREYVYNSTLCPQDKLVLLAIMSYMRPAKAESFPDLDTLGRRTSISRSQLILRKKDLVEYGWIKVTLEVRVKRSGPKSNVYRLPWTDQTLVVPEHCQLRRGRMENLRRGRAAKDAT